VVTKELTTLAVQFFCQCFIFLFVIYYIPGLGNYQKKSKSTGNAIGMPAVDQPSDR